MGVREIGHVHIVAHAGAVVRVVVGAEDGNVRPGAVRRLQHQRDEVRFRIVLLAQLALGIGAAGVEVTQRDGAQTMRGTGVAQDLPRPSAWCGHRC